MNKTFCICICLLCVSLYVHPQSDLDLGDFDRYIHKHKTQVAIGAGITFSGFILSVLGAGLSTYAISIQDGVLLDSQRSALTNSGYVVLGAGVLSLLIGFPVWFFSSKNYLETLDLRQQYFFITREK